MKLTKTNTLPPYLKTYNQRLFAGTNCERQPRLSSTFTANLIQTIGRTTAVRLRLLGCSISGFRISRQSRFSLEIAIYQADYLRRRLPASDQFRKAGPAQGHQCGHRPSHHPVPSRRPTLAYTTEEPACNQVARAK